MKKLTILTLIALVSYQSFGQLKFSAGIKGGLNLSKLDLSNPNTKSKTGYHAGVFAQFRFSKIALQPEIILSQQGSKLDLDSVLETSYINIPLILKIYLAAGINLQAGPQVGFLNKAELDGVDDNTLLKTADISAALGAGWDAPFGLTLDVRYNLGLTDNNNTLTDNEKVKNQVFQISVGFKIIRLGRK
jgi:hypothetical protein